MQYETRYGLRVEHSYDQAREYIEADPDTIKFPRRDALFLQKSHVYGQVEQGMRNWSEGQADQSRYRASSEQAPYVPPRPKPPRNVQEDPDAAMEESDAAMDPREDMDEITGGAPPPAPPGGSSPCVDR